MTSQNAIASLPSFAAFYELDRVAVPGSWGPTLAFALLRLIDRCEPVDLVVLRNLAEYQFTYGADLVRWKAELGSRRFKVPTGSSEKHPVAATLIRYVDAKRKSPGLELMLCVLCNAALDTETHASDSPIWALSEILRRALQDENSALRVILSGVKTIPDVLSRVENHLLSKDVVHQRFEGLWKSWIKGRLHYWMAADPERLRRAFAPRTLVPDVEAAEVVVAADAQAEPDDVAQTGSATTDPLDRNERERTPRTELRRAKAAAMDRASEGDLLAPPDQRVPKEVIIALIRSAMEHARDRQATGRVPESEPYIALAFALAAGLREIDLADVSWGEGDPVSARLHAREPVLRRPILRPPLAVNPGPELSGFLEPWSDHLDWPIPPTLHQMLVRLAQDNPVNGLRVLPRRAKQTIAPYRLRDVIAELQPGLALGASPFRQAMAAHLAELLGPDMAQLALADTFSMSASPTYYSALPQGDIAAAVGKLQNVWFGETTIVADAGAQCFIGSRLVLTLAAARQWPTDLRVVRKSIAHRKGATRIDAWVAHRNLLVAALCAITGHRPIYAIGEIDLDQVIPDYGLIVLRDKQVDPLRKVRIAATGMLWVAELRRFLDRLIVISADPHMPSAARLASAILRSEAPLFSVPDGDGIAHFTVAALRASMPEALRSVDNYYRHRLNQHLQRVGIDPELRHWQMGWVVSSAHATADMSPVSPRDLAAELAPKLDEFLVQDGWFDQARDVPPWTWTGVPSRPPKDWLEVARAHEEEHRLNVKRLREELHEHGRQAEADVLPRLADAVIELLPLLRLDQKAKRLIRAPGSGSSVADITEDICAMICDRVRQRDARPSEALEAVMTRIVLHRLIKKSHCEGLTSGAVPRRPYLSVTAENSPFLPGLGLAVRHAEELRCSLFERMEKRRPHDQGVVTVLSVLFFSPYRDLDWALEGVNGAAGAMRAQKPGDWLRVPAKTDRRAHPMVVSGLSGLLLAQRGRDASTAKAPKAGEIEAWMREKLSLPFGVPIESEILGSVIQTMRAAGRVELSGPERLLMLGTVSLAATSVERCLAYDDQWPVRTRLDDNTVVDDPRGAVYAQDVDVPSTARGQAATVAHYEKLTALLNPDRFWAVVGKKADDHRGWRARLGKELHRLGDQVGPTTTLGLLVAFASHRLRYGGKKRRHLEHNTLHGDITRFARDLLDVVATRSLLTMDGDTLRGVYLAVLVGKSKSARPETLAAVRVFHQFLEDVHQAEDVSFAELASFAGPRVARAAPGLLTDSEVETCHDVLKRDLADESARSDASPDFMRLAELRLLMFILLEASGARPGSIHGLLLSDLLLFGEGRDFIHLHRTGAYGEIKTRTSAGFVRLDGALWQRSREWVRQWVEKECKDSPPDAISKTPLFAHAKGNRRRFSDRYLTSRIGDLLKWATDERKAKPYWLRKRRIMVRHASIGATGKIRARDVYTALCISGHADILTPLSNYICDPAIAFRHSLNEGRHTSRARLLAVTGLKAQPLDMAWQRHGGPKSEARLAIVFDRMPIEAINRPKRRETAAPPLRRQLQLLPRHIDLFAHAMHKDESLDQALVRSGLSSLQVDRLQRAVATLLLQRGKAPWRVDGLRHPRTVMQPPRRLEGTEPLFQLLESQPTPSLRILANAWAARGHPGRLDDDPVLLQLINSDEEQAAHRVLISLGLSRDLIRPPAGNTIFPTLHVPVRAMADPSAKSDVTTMGAALAWVLAIIWLHQEIASGAKAPAL